MPGTKGRAAFVCAPAPFHVIVEGRCQLEVADRPSFELAPGDLVVFPHGDRHALFSEPDVSRVPFSAVLEANGIRNTWAPGKRIEELDRIRFGGSARRGSRCRQGLRQHSD